MKWILIGLVQFYRWVISPMLGPRCRFYPTCSEYALIALREYGAVKGSWLAVKRIARCHPGCEGGFDPVPGTEPPEELSTEDSKHDDR